MANKTKTSTIKKSSDVEFEPYSEWKKEEGAETLSLHLPGFRKDQLRVQVNNLGGLKVSGEKPLAEDGKRKTHFLKETKVPDGSNINGIRAKFIGSQLIITIPKKAPTVPQTVQKPEEKSTPVSEASQKLNAEALVSNDEKLKAPVNGNGSMTANTSYDKTKNIMFRQGNSLARLQVQKKIVVSVGVVVVALVAIGAYMAYNFGSGPSFFYPLSRIEE